MTDIIDWGGSIEVVEMVKVEQVVIGWEWRATEKRLDDGTRIKESLDKRWRNEFASNQLTRYNLQRWLAALVPARYSANPTNTDTQREKMLSLRKKHKAQNQNSKKETHKSLALIQCPIIKI